MDNDGWIENTGVEPDFTKGARIDLKFRDVETYYNQVSGEWDWCLDYVGADITHWRYSKIKASELAQDGLTADKIEVKTIEASVDASYLTGCPWAQVPNVKSVAEPIKAHVEANGPGPYTYSWAGGEVFFLGPGFAEIPAEPARNKYMREIKPGVWVDVYDILNAFKVTDPCLQHLLKKALAVGQRGHKDTAEDYKDILASAERAVELFEEWNK